MESLDEIAGYFLRKIMGSEAGKRIAPLWIKKTPVAL
jgi:hypothetical protein